MSKMKIKKSNWIDANIKTSKESFDIRNSKFSESINEYRNSLNLESRTPLNHKERADNIQKSKEINRLLTHVRDSYNLVNNEYPTEHINRNNRSAILLTLKKMVKKPEFYKLEEKEIKTIKNILINYNIDAFSSDEVYF